MSCSKRHIILVAEFFKAEFKDKEIHTEYAINTAKNRQMSPLLLKPSKTKFKPNAYKTSVSNSNKTHSFSMK
jgi:hypothetical protein